MYTFKDKDDLMETIKRCAMTADLQAADDTNLKREQLVARARAAAFRDVLEFLEDYFAARPNQ